MGEKNVLFEHNIHDSSITTTKRKGRKLDWDRQILWLEAKTLKEVDQEVEKVQIPVFSYPFEEQCHEL